MHLVPNEVPSVPQRRFRNGPDEFPAFGTPLARASEVIPAAFALVPLTASLLAFLDDDVPDVVDNQYKDSDRRGQKWVNPDRGSSVDGLEGTQSKRFCV